MMGSSLTRALTAAAIAAHAAFAFNIVFYEADNCVGAQTGTASHVFKVPGSGKLCYNIPAGSAGADVTRTSNDYDDSNVGFYDVANCGDGLKNPQSAKVAVGNNGCVALDAFGRSRIAKSYEIEAENAAGPGAKRRHAQNPSLAVDQNDAVDEPWWTFHQREHRERLGISESEATGSLSPYWDPYASVSGGFGHGNVTERWGQVWKWQQVALGITMGIPIDEWDDNIHILNESFVVYGDFSDTANEKREPGNLASILPVDAMSELTKRWNYAQCSSVLSCVKQFGGSASLTLAKGWQQTVNAWHKTVAVKNTFYDWGHNHPISVGVATTAGGTIVGYGLGKTGGGATAQDNNQLGQCANDNSQVQTFVQAILTAANGGNQNAVEVNINLPDGNILTISGEVYPKGHKPVPESQCNA